MNGKIKTGLLTSFDLAHRSMSIVPNDFPKAPIYEVKGGIRYVQPYFQTIKTTVKRRWLNRSVLDVLSTEFRSFGMSDYRNRLEKDEISVLHRQKFTKRERKERRNSNAKKSDQLRIKYPEIMDYKMADNDIIERLEHIHERSVHATNSQDIEVIHEDDDVLVVCKPSGIPIHPVQNYYYNSFVHVLQREGWPGREELSKDIQLRPCHRLDKLTSGVCIFAKSSESARKIQMDIQNRSVRKTYLARVVGRFPGLNGKEKCDEVMDVECCDDVVVLDTKKGKDAGMMVKEAKTIFRGIKFNEELNESVVKCWPQTGRTHQIRIHLRNLGHPIVNDPLYGPEGLMSSETGNDSVVISEEAFDRIKNEATRKRLETESDESCKICGVKLYTQTESSDLIMYLHAYKYELCQENGWVYQTESPEWCNI